MLAGMAKTVLNVLFVPVFQYECSCSFRQKILHRRMEKGFMVPAGL